MKRWFCQRAARPLCWVMAGLAPSLWLGASLLTAGKPPPALLAAFGVFAALLLLLWPGEHSAPRLLLLGAGIALGLLGWGHGVQMTPLLERAGYGGSITIELTGPALGRGEYGVAPCRVVALGQEKVSFPSQIYLTDASPDFQAGQTLVVEGKLVKAPTEPERGFIKEGIFLLVSQTGSITVQPGKTPLWALPAQLRGQMAQCFAQHLPQGRGALLTGMLTGDKEQMTAQQRRALSLSGTAHLTAVSGLHISTLLALLLGLLGRRWGMLLGLPLCFFYVLLAGGTPSALRAFLMGALPLVAWVFRRESDSLANLAAALGLLLVTSPLSVLDAGLQLSFAGALGLLWLLPPWQAAIQRKFAGGGWGKKLAAGLWSGLAASGAALALTLPLSALIFGRVSLLSLLTNLLIVPLLPCILALGLLLAAVHPLGAFFSGAVAALLSPLLGWVEWVQNTGSKLPFASAPGGDWFLLLFSLVALVLCLWQMLRPATRNRALAALGSFALICFALGSGQQALLQPVVLTNTGGSGLVLTRSQGHNTGFIAGQLQGDGFFTAAQRGLERMDGDGVDTLWLTQSEGVGPLSPPYLRWARVDRVMAPANTPSQLLPQGQWQYQHGGVGDFTFAGGSGFLLPGGGALLQLPGFRLLLACGLEEEGRAALLEQPGLSCDVLVADGAWLKDLPGLRSLTEGTGAGALVCLQPAGSEAISLAGAFGGPIANLASQESIELSLFRYQ